MPIETRTYTSVVSRSHEDWVLLDDLSFKAKNVYNSTLYVMRQAFLVDKVSPPRWNTVCNRFVHNHNPDYYALPSKVSQAVVKEVGSLFKAFFGSIKSAQGNHKVSLPRYKDSTKGRTVVPFNNQTFSLKRKVRDDLYEYTVCPRSFNLRVYCPSPNVKFIRIVPHSTHYAIECVYDIEIPESTPDYTGKVMGIDIGVDNLATCVVTDGTSFIMNGRHIKSINRYYNKCVSKMKSRLPEGVKTSNRIKSFTVKRNRKIDWELHNTSRVLVNLAVSLGVQTVVIGKNTAWKQDINIGKVNNQKFVSIPHVRFIDQLVYKLEQEGIAVVLTEESYTSKASSLDLDDIPVYQKGVVPGASFSGRRIKRGLYRSGSGVLLNADANGAVNIVRKVAPNIQFDGVLGAVVHPDRVFISRSGHIKW